jgi:uncharacterized tellurite resistance protein B-like protein
VQRDHPAAEPKGRIVKTIDRRIPAASQRSADELQPVPFTPTSVQASATSPAPSRLFKLPESPKNYGPGIWTSPGQNVVIGDAIIPGGMVYVGTSLPTASGYPDPCLIDPSKQIARHGEFRSREMGYWPSFSDISPVARRAYLNWLADGRRDPEADVGYVFLFFYGLERRVIVDAPKDPAAAADIPAIASELRRLIGVYGQKSHSFLRYASELLNWASLNSFSADLYTQPVPDFPKTLELPLYVRLALGLTAVNGVPVPAHLALSWAKLDPSNNLRTPAVRCAEQFDALFVRMYAQAFGLGIMLPLNKTKLKFVYQAASSAFRGVNVTLSFHKTPDVTALTAPIKKIQALVEDVTKALEPFSRYAGRNPTTATALEGLLLLPATLWPADVQQSLNALKARMGEGMLVLTFQELLSKLGAESALSKDQSSALARALESVNVGIEPDVLGGARAPKLEDKVVLFVFPTSEDASRSSSAYQAAALTLQLASAVAVADGDFSSGEMSHLRRQVQSWTHLTPHHLRRLLAHLRLLMLAPVPLSALKKKLEPLDAASKETIAAFMATVAQSDGEILPAEVKMLEKVYQALGIEPKKVFSDVHAAAAGVHSTPVVSGGPGSGASQAVTGFKLDPARLAALQKDTEHVSALLAGIFTEEEPAAVLSTAVAIPEAVTDAEAPAPAPASGLLGLDDKYTAFARMLLSRPQWTREELLDVAQDLELMLDGALERVNEAAFDAHDVPFTEGDDPVEINAEIMEKIDA